MSALQIALLIALGAALLTAATTDLRARIIPNRLNAAVALLAAGWWIATGLSWSAAGTQIAIAALTFAGFAGIFALGWMGGGDVKLIGAIALWLPASLLFRMLVLMVLAGGLLSLAVLIHHRWRRNQDAPEVPYGVAIAAAALFVVTNDLLTITAA